MPSSQSRPLILITGSNGLIGGTLVKQLANDYQIVGLDLELPDHRVNGVDYRRMDVSQIDSIHTVLEELKDFYGERITSVIHLAAYYSFEGGKSPKYQEITVEGTRNFLAILRELFTVEQFIFSSTMLVHEPAVLGEEIQASSPVDPSWEYPASKVAAEAAINEEKGNIPVVLLRIAGIYDDYGHSIPLGQHIVRIYERQLGSLLFPGNAQHGQSFLHMEDLKEAMRLLVEKRQQLPKTLTLVLGEDEALSYNELQSTLGELIHGRPWPTFRIPRLIATAGAFAQQYTPFMRKPFIKPWMIPHSDEHYDVNPAAVQRHLGWQPQHSLRESLPKIVASLKKNPAKWYKDHKIEEPRLRSVEVKPEDEGVYQMSAFAVMLMGAWVSCSVLGDPAIGAFELWHNIAMGVLIAITAGLTLLPALRWLRWVNAAMASWLMLSPLVVWTSSPAQYSSMTILSAFIILACTYTPSENRGESEHPTGWSYNPSAWSQRVPIILLGFVGFQIARYLSAFQLGHIGEVWDPFFGIGTALTLTSDISKAFPVSDAGLGAVSYLLDVVATCIGGKNRWRTMPWMVILFGLFVIPTGVTSITLIMLQPIGVGAWCTLCLATAFIMLIMVPPAIDEVVASVSFIRTKMREGQGFWKTLFFGGEMSETRTPVAAEEKAFPWHLLASAAFGCWLMATPYLFELMPPASTSVYIISALIVTFSIIALSEVARIVRSINVVLAIALAMTAVMMGNMEMLARIHFTIVALLVAVCNVPRGKMGEHFGQLDRWVRLSVTDFVGTHRPHNKH